jgi:hypothetical protein
MEDKPKDPNFENGDSEFDDFLHKHSGEDGGEGEPIEVMECQKRLLFDIVAQKTDILTSMLAVYSDLYTKHPGKYKEKLENVENALEEGINQIDMTLCLILKEMGLLDDGEEENNTTDPKKG